MSMLTVVRGDAATTGPCTCCNHIMPFTPASPLEDAAHHPPHLELTTLSDADLITWVRRSMFAAGLAPRFTVRKYRWRKAFSNANRELSARVIRHAGVGATCDVCHVHPVTHHQIRDGAAGSQFEHHCRECAQSAPSGWFVVAAITR